jgi:hypothetical protein
MKRYLWLYKLLAAAALTTGFHTSPAVAGTIVVDDGVSIVTYSPSGGGTVYSTSLVGGNVMSMVFTTHDSAVGSGPVLLTAPSEGSDIYAYAPGGGTATVFAAVNNPYGLAIDGNGDVYTGANGGTTLEELSPTGTVLKTIANNVDVESLAISGAGDLFEADGNTGTVIEYTPGGAVSTFASLAVTNGNDGMAFDNAGDLYVTYVTPKHGGGIYEISTSGVVSTFYSAATVLPTSLVFDTSTGDLDMTYVNSNGSGGGVSLFSPNAAGLPLASSYSVVATDANTPGAIAVFAPEPGSITLLLSGLIALALSRLRRQKPAA